MVLVYFFCELIEKMDRYFKSLIMNENRVNIHFIFPWICYFITTSYLLSERDKIEFNGRTLDVRDARGAGVFRASRDEVRVFADTYVVDGAGGITVKSALQVPLVRAPPAASLR